MAARLVHSDPFHGFNMGAQRVYEQSESLCHRKDPTSHIGWVYGKVYRCTLDRDKVTCPKCLELLPPTWRDLLYAALERKYELPEGSITNIDERAYECQHCGIEWETDLNMRVGDKSTYLTIESSLASILEELMALHDCGVCGTWTCAKCGYKRVRANRGRRTDDGTPLGMECAHCPSTEGTWTGIKHRDGSWTQRCHDEDYEDEKKAGVVHAELTGRK